MPIRDQDSHSLAHKYPDVAAQWDYARNGALKPTHVRPGSNRPVHWICGNGHRWVTTPNTRTRGHGCAACRGMVATPERNLATERPDMLALWDHSRNLDELHLVPEQVLVNSGAVVWWFCPTNPLHGHDAKIANKTKSPGCPYCAGKRVNSTNSVAGQRPLLALEWDPENDRGPEEVAVGSNYPAQWICRVDSTHKWASPVYSRPENGAGCPFCDGKVPSMRNRLDIMRPDIAAQWHPTKNGGLRPDQISIRSNKRVWWLCPNDPLHPWYVSPNARHDGDGCSWCAPVIRSQQDIRIAAEFAHVFPGEVNPGRGQKRFDLGHNRPYTVDVLLEARRVVIEFDGSYYHSGREHEDRDDRKTRALTALGYRVVRIRENPLPLMDGLRDISVPRGASIKAILDATLKQLCALGWVEWAEIAPYLAEREVMAAARAERIIEALEPSERFVPPSRK